MDRLRYFALALALVLPTIAIRLGGTTLWVVYGAGLVVCAGIALYSLWSDEMLRDVMRPRGLDLSLGMVPAAALIFSIVWVHQHYIAPPSELGGLLRKCVLEGARFPRGDVHGIGKVFEWVRAEVCRSYGVSLGVTGPMRGLVVFAVASLEEIAWRGGIQQLMSEKLGSTRGWLVTALLFGLAHVPTGQWLLSLLALACGLLWGAMYRYRGRLVPSLVSHAAFSYGLFYSLPLADFT